MTEFLIANIAPIFFVSMILFLLTGFPVAFALAANGFIFGMLCIQLGLFEMAQMQALSDRIFDVMRNETLLAVPFFTFMGLILERSGMAEDLLDTIGELFGPIRGGVAYAVIFVGAILAATTGVVAASVISMGLISLPIMLRYGYNKRVATGTIAASGTLAQIIPPSLVLILMADQLGKDIGQMYQGALIPGVVLTSLYALFILTVSILRPKWLPAIPKELRRPYGKAMFLRVLTSLLPTLLLVLIVLGSVLAGIATPTEAGATGATGALIMAYARKRLNQKLLIQAMESTAKLTTFVVFILIGARFFSLTFYLAGGDRWVEHLLTNLPGGQIGFLLIVNLTVFLLAFFLDYFELSFIVIPLLKPVADALGIDLIWFGVLLAVNMQTSFLHPPFGFALFFLRSVSPASVRTSDIYWGAIPFVLIQILMVGLLILFPQLVTWNLDKEMKVDLDTITIEAPSYGYDTYERQDEPTEPHKTPSP